MVKDFEVARTVSFVLNGQLKSGKNNMRIDPRTGRHYPLLEFVQWRDQASKQIFRQIKTVETMKNECALFVNYWSGDARRRDVAGMLDAIGHLLEKTFLIEDDSLMKNITWISHGLDKKNPRAEITLCEII